MVTAVKKITVKEMSKGKFDTVEVTLPDPQNPEKTIKKQVAATQDVCLIVGQAHSIEQGSTQYGPYTVFIGRFQGRRVADGEIFQSTRVIFPQIAEDIALQHFLDAKAVDDTAIAEMAFMIGVEADNRGDRGYKFTIRPLSTGEQAPDPLQNLLARVAGELADTLPAPVMAKLALPAPSGGDQNDANHGTDETADNKSGKSKTSA